MQFCASYSFNRLLRRGPRIQFQTGKAKRMIDRIFVAAVLGATALTEVSRGSDPFDGWTWRNPLPSGNRLNGLDFDQDRFVIVGDAGTILVSSDTTNWVRATSNTDTPLHGVAHGGSLLLT